MEKYGIENLHDLVSDMREVTQKLAEEKTDDGILKIGEILQTLPKGLAIYADVDTKEEREALKNEALDISREEGHVLQEDLIDIIFDLVDIIAPTEKPE